MKQEIEKGLLHQPSIKKITVLRLRATAAAVVAAFIIGAVFVFSRMIATVLTVLCLLLYVLTITVYAKLMYKVSGYFILEDTIVVKKGVIFLRETHMKLDKIEYTVKTQTFIQRKLKVFSLSIFSQGAKAVLHDIESMPLLKKEEQV